MCPPRQWPLKQNGLLCRYFRLRKICLCTKLLENRYGISYCFLVMVLLGGDDPAAVPRKDLWLIFHHQILRLARHQLLRLIILHLILVSADLQCILYVQRGLMSAYLSVRLICVQRTQSVSILMANTQRRSDVSAGGGSLLKILLCQVWVCLHSSLKSITDCNLVKRVLLLCTILKRIDKDLCFCKRNSEKAQWEGLSISQANQNSCINSL